MQNHRPFWVAVVRFGAFPILRAELGPPSPAPRLSNFTRHQLLGNLQSAQISRMVATFAILQSEMLPPREAPREAEHLQSCNLKCGKCSASRGAPVSWCSSVSGGCPSTVHANGLRVRFAPCSFVRLIPPPTHNPRPSTYASSAHYAGHHARAKQVVHPPHTCWLVSCFSPGADTVFQGRVKLFFSRLSHPAEGGLGCLGSRGRQAKPS